MRIKTHILVFIKVNAYALLFILSFFNTNLCQAQYYPVPPHLDPARENELLNQVKASYRNESEIHALLQLSSIYYYRHLKLKSNLNKALTLAQQAYYLSNQLHLAAQINVANFYLGEIYIAERKMAAAEQLLNLVDDTTRLKLLLNLSVYNDFNSGTLTGYATNALMYAKQAVILAKRLGHTSEVLIAELNIANINLENGEFDRCGYELKTIFADQNKKSKELLRFSYITYCLLNLYQGNNDKGLRYSTKAMKTIIDSRDSIQAGDCYMAQAIAYYCIENNQLSFLFAQKAIESYSQWNGEGSIALAVNYGDLALTKAKKYRESHIFLDNMLKVYPPQNVYDNIQYLSTRGYLYKGEKNYAQAEKYYFKILTTAKLSHIEDESSYRNIGDVLVQDHKYTQAKPYLIKSLNFPGNLTSLRIKSLVHYYLFLCDSVGGDYLSAIKDLKIAGEMNDKIKDAAKTAAISKFQIQYETEEKGKELKIKDQNIIMLRQANQIGQVSLAHAQLVKKETLAGIFVLLTLLAVAIGYYRQKQKVNKIIIRKNKTITQKNGQLEHLVAEKEWLLKEVHHRVKNNLHTVICLLESQAMYLKNDALQAVENSRHRIYAMSLIHQKLYQSDDIRALSMKIYLADFVIYLQESFGSPENISINLFADPIKLGVGQAIPVGLVVNEAVTNAFKYAFPDQLVGEINIRLQKSGSKVYLLITDNGIGFKQSGQEANSLGLDLIKGLTDDLRGDIEIESNNGTSIKLIFESELVDLFAQNEEFLI